MEEPIEEDEEEEAGADTEEEEGATKETEEGDDDDGVVEEEDEEGGEGKPKTKKVDKTTWDWVLINDTKPIWLRRYRSSCGHYLESLIHVGIILSCMSWFPHELVSSLKHGRMYLLFCCDMTL